MRADRVFKRVGIRLSSAEIEGVIAATPGVIEGIIIKFKHKVIKP